MNNPKARPSSKRTLTLCEIKPSSMPISAIAELRSIVGTVIYPPQKSGLVASEYGGGDLLNGDRLSEVSAVVEQAFLVEMWRSGTGGVIQIAQTNGLIWSDLICLDVSVI